jgi:hypothetical protein
LNIFQKSQMLLRDMYYQFLTTHLHQISRLTDMVESLQSQIMQLDNRRESSRKTSSARGSKSIKKTKKNKAIAKKPKGKSSKRKK